VLELVEPPPAAGLLLALFVRLEVPELLLLVLLEHHGLELLVDHVELLLAVVSGGLHPRGRGDAARVEGETTAVGANGAVVVVPEA